MASPDVTIIMAPQWPAAWPWPAPAYICESLRRRGFTVQSLDYNLRLHALCKTLGYEYLWADSSFEAWASGALNFLAHLIELDEIAGDVVGFSTTTSNLPLSIALAERVRQRFPKRTILFGGHAVFDVDEIRSVPTNLVDALCKGDGERTVCELLGNPRERWTTIPGVYLPDEEGWRLTAERPLETNLDTIDTPTFEEVDLTQFDNRFLPIMASRGCIGRCIFCSDRLRAPCYRTRSAAHQMKELEYLASRYDVDYFPYHDPLMNGDLDVLTEKTDLLLRRGLNTRFGGNMMVRMDMSDDLVVALRKSGMTTALIGVESGSRKVLRDMRKKHRPDMAAAFIRQLHNAGIRIELNFMVGFPTEAEADFHDTLTWIRDNRSHIDAIISAGTFCFVKSELMERRDEFGIVMDGPDKFHDWHSLQGANSFEVRQDRLRRLLAVGEELGLLSSSMLSDQHRADVRSIPRSKEFAARYQSFVEGTDTLSAAQRQEAMSAIDRVRAAGPMGKGPAALAKKALASLRRHGLKASIQRGKEWLRLHR